MDIAKNRRLILFVILVIVFLVQAYFMVYSVIPGYVEPFKNNKSVYDYVNNGFFKVWAMTLFWPLYLLVTSAVELFFKDRK
jgi:hypothetical protein